MLSTKWYVRLASIDLENSDVENTMWNPFAFVDSEMPYEYTAFYQTRLNKTLDKAVALNLHHLHYFLSLTSRSPESTSTPQIFLSFSMRPLPIRLFVAKVFEPTQQQTLLTQFNACYGLHYELETLLDLDVRDYIKKYNKYLQQISQSKDYGKGKDSQYKYNSFNYYSNFFNYELKNQIKHEIDLVYVVCDMFYRFTLKLWFDTELGILSNACSAKLDSKTVSRLKAEQQISDYRNVYTCLKRLFEMEPVGVDAYHYGDQLCDYLKGLKANYDRTFSDKGRMEAVLKGLKKYEQHLVVLDNLTEKQYDILSLFCTRSRKYGKYVYQIKQDDSEHNRNKDYPKLSTVSTTTNTSKSTHIKTTKSKSHSSMDLDSESMSMGTIKDKKDKETKSKGDSEIVCRDISRLSSIDYEFDQSLLSDLDHNSVSAPDDYNDSDLLDYLNGKVSGQNTSCNESVLDYGSIKHTDNCKDLGVERTDSKIDVIKTQHNLNDSFDDLDLLNLNYDTFDSEVLKIEHIDDKLKQIRAQLRNRKLYSVVLYKFSVIGKMSALTNDEHCAQYKFGVPRGKGHWEYGRLVVFKNSAPPIDQFNAIIEQAFQDVKTHQLRTLTVAGWFKHFSFKENNKFVETFKQLFKVKHEQLEYMRNSWSYEREYSNFIQMKCSAEEARTKHVDWECVKDVHTSNTDGQKVIDNTNTNSDTLCKRLDFGCFNSEYRVKNVYSEKNLFSKHNYNIYRFRIY